MHVYAATAASEVMMKMVMMMMMNTADPYLYVCVSNMLLYKRVQDLRVINAKLKRTYAKSLTKLTSTRIQFHMCS